MNSYISTFLGFISALSVQFLFKYITDYKNMQHILKGIKQEFKNIEEQLLSLNDDNYYVTPLNTSYWRSLSQTSSMNTILTHSLYTEIVTVYHYVENINEWENIRSFSYFATGKHNQLLTTALKKQRADLLIELRNILINFD